MCLRNSLINHRKSDASHKYTKLVTVQQQQHDENSAQITRIQHSTHLCCHRRILLGMSLTNAKIDGKIFHLHSFHAKTKLR